VEQLRGRRSALDNFITASDSAKTDVEIGISEKAVAAASQRLSDCIWQPLVGALQTGGRVYIGAEGSLGLIPFEIFSRLDERGNLKYLVEDREIVLRRQRSRFGSFGDGSENSCSVKNGGIGWKPRI